MFISHTHELQGWNSVIIFIDTEKVFDKIQHLFMQRINGTS